MAGGHKDIQDNESSLLWSPRTFIPEQPVHRAVLTDGIGFDWMERYEEARRNTRHAEMRRSEVQSAPSLSVRSRAFLSISIHRIKHEGLGQAFIGSRGSYAEFMTMFAKMKPQFNWIRERHGRACDNTTRAHQFLDNTQLLFGASHFQNMTPGSGACNLLI